MLKLITLPTIAPHSTNYAHGVSIPAGARLMVSNGHIGTRLDGTSPEDVATQTEIIFERLQLVLEADGMGLTDIAQITTYLTEIPYQEDYKQVRDRIMGEHKPPNPILIIKDLVRVPLKVEIEILAAKL